MAKRLNNGKTDAKKKRKKRKKKKKAAASIEDNEKKLYYRGERLLFYVSTMMPEAQVAFLKQYGRNRTMVIRDALQYCMDHNILQSADYYAYKRRHGDGSDSSVKP